MTSLYVCDRTKPCHLKAGCGTDCMHTQDKAYAKYKLHLSWDYFAGGVRMEKPRKRDVSHYSAYRR